MNIELYYDATEADRAEFVKKDIEKKHGIHVSLNQYPQS